MNISSTAGLQGDPALSGYVASKIGNLVVYLASDESTFCTGAEFVADGGELAGLPT